jgi:hypothetical protein
MITRLGQCTCGNVRYRLSGEPARVGICHCTSCRKASGSMFTTYGIWPKTALETDGETITFEGRSFCPQCGSSLFALSDAEAEIQLCTLDDAPTDLTPSYELWIRRREPWLSPLPGAEQHDKDRPETGFRADVTDN